MDRRPGKDALEDETMAITERIRLPGCREWVEIERGIWLSECSRFRIEASELENGWWTLFDTQELDPRHDGFVWTRRFVSLPSAMSWAERL